MKIIFTIAILITLVFLQPLYSNTLVNKIHFLKNSSIIEYADPLPGAEYVNPDNNILIRLKDIIRKESVFNNKSVTVTGNVAGEYSYTVYESKERGVLILKLWKKYIRGEKITVRFNQNLEKTNNSFVTPEEYSFTVKKSDAPYQKLQGLVNETEASKLGKLTGSDYSINEIPSIFVTTNNNPAPGFIFFSNIVFNGAIQNTPHLLVVNNQAQPVLTKLLPNQAFDFKKQYNGNFTYFDFVREKYYEVDTSFNIVDSFYTGNGYVTDLHELKVLPNRNALLMSYDMQIVDMRNYLPGADSEAVVTGLIIQEIDRYKNVVFQWRSWDHFAITDAVHEDLYAHKIDYVHGNAIELDNDNNIMISSRHLDEITKINSKTGDIIWRFGGKNNQFTFINDTRKFCYQHDIRRIKNGNITLYDNGNYHTPQYSRAVEYRLDEINKTAELVWQYNNTPNTFGYAMGNAQRLDNGNTVIGWGSTNPTFTEVKPDGTKALQMTFSNQVYSYRVFKHNLGPEPLTGVNSVNTALNFHLSQNYPNPFNPSTKISFELSEMGLIKLEVFDLLGKEVKVLVNKVMNPGSYTIDFNASELPSGVYFYRLAGSGYSEIKKMVIVK